jgi:hypothetical protein
MPAWSRNAFPATVAMAAVAGTLAARGTTEVKFHNKSEEKVIVQFDPDDPGGRVFPFLWTRYQSLKAFPWTRVLPTGYVEEGITLGPDEFLSMTYYFEHSEVKTEAAEWSLAFTATDLRTGVRRSFTYTAWRHYVSEIGERCHHACVREGDGAGGAEGCPAGLPGTGLPGSTEANPPMVLRGFGPRPGAPAKPQAKPAAPAGETKAASAPAATEVETKAVVAASLPAAGLTLPETVAPAGAPASTAATPAAARPLCVATSAVGSCRVRCPNPFGGEVLVVFPKLSTVSRQFEALLFEREDGEPVVSGFRDGGDLEIQAGEGQALLLSYDFREFPKALPSVAFTTRFWITDGQAVRKYAYRATRVLDKETQAHRLRAQILEIGDPASGSEAAQAPAGAGIR